MKTKPPVALAPYQASPLAGLAQARRLLAEARSVDDIKQIRDQAELARLYARQRAMGLDAENYAAEIKVRAERRLGQVLATMEKNRGAATPSHDGSAFPPPTLRQLGLTANESSRFQRVAGLPEASFEQHIADAITSHLHLTSAGLLRQAEAQELAEFGLLVEEAVERNDTNGTLARAQMRRAWSAEMWRIVHSLQTFTPEMVLSVFEAGDLDYYSCRLRELEQWVGDFAARLEAASGPGLHLVEEAELQPQSPYEAPA
jgi:hypothetical protein